MPIVDVDHIQNLHLFVMRVPLAKEPTELTAVNIGQACLAGDKRAIIIGPGEKPPAADFWVKERK